MKINIKVTFLLIIIILLFTVCSKNSSYPWYIKKMKLNEAWKISTGNGVTIAFLDTGISKEYFEKNLNRIIFPYNLLTKNTDITDKIGHGTEIIAATCGSIEEFGLYGIAPESKIIPIIVSDETGHITPDNLAEGIKWAVSHEAKIINLSIGSHIYNKNVENEILAAINKHIIVVASAGDYSQKDLLFPASMANVIAVASQNKTGKISDFSNYSENKLYVLIPGEEIETISINENKNNIKKIVNGTSISCSLMSGIIALMLEVNPNSSFETISTALEIASKNSKFINVKDLLNNIK
jgi:subtilisin family serine protease